MATHLKQLIDFSKSKNFKHLYIYMLALKKKEFLLN